MGYGGKAGIWRILAMTFLGIPLLAIGNDAIDGLLKITATTQEIYLVHKSDASDLGFIAFSKCNCPPGTLMGTYTNQVTVSYPYGITRPRISIDRCLIEELKGLWDMGIETHGSCCGHGYLVSWIGVDDEYIPMMEELGYKVRYKFGEGNENK